MTKKTVEQLQDVGAEPDPPLRQPLQEPEDGWPADEFTGQAGSFSRDPFTGTRSRLEEPTEPRPDALS